MSVLDVVATWPVDHAAAALVGPDRTRPDSGTIDAGTVARAGDTTRQFRLASLTKPVAAWAMLIAVEEGIVRLDTPVGQPGCTLRHLLYHAGGYGFDGSEPVSPPERNRIYSNTGFELAAAAVAETAGMSFADYLTEAVLRPLGMDASTMHGTAAHGLWSNVDDMVRFAHEVRRPTLISEGTARLGGEIQFPDLSGIVPGVGRFSPCPWGAGFEVRGHKSPHWTGTRNSPRTFGHFGGAGTMMWFDPAIDTALIALTDRPFDQWAPEALRAWPALSDAVVAAAHTSAGTGADGTGADDTRAVW